MFVTQPPHPSYSSSPPATLSLFPEIKSLLRFVSLPSPILFHFFRPFPPYEEFEKQGREDRRGREGKMKQDETKEGDKP